MFEEEQFWKDIRVSCGNKIANALKRCRKFKNLEDIKEYFAEHPLKEIRIPNFGPTCYYALLDYLYPKEEP